MLASGCHIPYTSVSGKHAMGGWDKSNSCSLGCCFMLLYPDSRFPFCF